MRDNKRPSQKGGHQERHISVRGIRRDPPDLRKLSRALIDLAVAQAEADAQAEQPAAVPKKVSDDQ